MESNKQSWAFYIASKIFYLPKLAMRIFFSPLIYLVSKNQTVPNPKVIENSKQEEKINYKEYFISNADLKEKFEKACNLLKSCDNLSNDQQLSFYALFKQAKEGNCTKSKPNIFDVVEGKKWEAWKSREGMKSSEAMELYIKTMSEIALPLLNKKENEDDDVFMDENELEEENQENRGFGMKMSRIVQNEQNDTNFDIKNTQKSETTDNFFDLVLNENTEEIKKIIEKGYDLKDKNSSGVAPIHFSIDNEKINSFLILLPYYEKIDINLPDATGMTPLHYALCINNTQLIEEILKRNPDPYIKDSNGEDCISLASQKQLELINKFLKKD